MRHAHLLFGPAFALLVTALLTACAGHRDPLAPTAAQPETQVTGSSRYVLDGVNQQALGVWTLEIAGDSARVVPQRQASLAAGALFQLDVTTALTDTICWDCLTVTSIRRSGSAVEVELDLRHPMPLADTFMPPSAKNRRDLWLNNVRGVLLIDNGRGFFSETVRLDPAIVMNADGWTDQVQKPIDFDATAFPYKVFGATGANLGPGNFDADSGWLGHLDAPSGYNVFANEQHVRTTYRLSIAPGSTVAFDLTLLANWGIAAPTINQRLLPRYYMPAGTPPEAWRATVTPSGSLVAEDPTSTIDLTFEVLDWQQDPALSVDAGFPNQSNPLGLIRASRIKSVSFSLPGITGAETTLVPLTGASGRGLAADPWVLTYPLSNVMSAMPGTYLGVAEILDERPTRDVTQPESDPTFLTEDLQTAWLPSGEFATWTVFRVTVSGGASGCMGSTIVRSGLFSTYVDPDPFYTVARTEAEALAALSAVEGAAPGPLPTIDFATQSLVVAATGRTAEGRGQRTVSLGSVCPAGPETWELIFKRGEPLSACATADIPASPYLIAIIDIAPANTVLTEQEFDTCNQSGCVTTPFRSVLRGNAATNGYQGGADLIYCANQQGYEDFAGPLLGNQTPPFINFPYEEALIITSGYSTVGDAGRDLMVTDLCLDTTTGNYRLDYTLWEYISCAPPVPPMSGPDAPFEVIAVPCCGMLVLPQETVIDTCLPPVCDTALTPVVLVQADARDGGDGTAFTGRFSEAASFAARWEQYFPEIAAPAVDFATRDAYMIAGAREPNAGDRWFSVEDVCYGTTPAPTVTVNYTLHERSSGCSSLSTAHSQPVLVFTTARPPLSTSISFASSMVPDCGPENCTVPTPSVIETGDIAVSWSGPGADLIVGNRPMFQHLWELVHGPGALAPPVNFAQFDVLFTTSGYHATGLGLHDQLISVVCSEGAAGRAVIVERDAQNCPNPAPEPTTPYLFAEIPRGHGLPGGSPIWYAIERTTTDRCNPQETCTPEFAPTILLGHGSPNESTGITSRLIKDQADLDLFWEAWFDPSGQFFEKPVVDWTAHDVLFYATGVEEESYGSRSVWADELCVDPAAEYVRVHFLRHEVDRSRCLPFDDPTHPWCVVLLPAGAAEGWTVEVTSDIVPGCPGETDYVLPQTEIAQSLESDYLGVPSWFVLCNEIDYAARLQSYRDAWADLGTGDPPGIADIGPLDAVVVVAGGYLPADHGRHDVYLDSLTAMIEAGSLRLKPRVTLPFSCDGDPRPTSPYRIYRVPLVQWSYYEDYLGADDACD